MNFLETTDEGSVISSEVISVGADIQHKNILATIEKYPADFSSFGGVAFETRPFMTAGGEQSRRVALLNSEQATLLMTYLKNTDVVRKFKVRLVKAFSEKPPLFQIPTTLAGALQLAADQAAINEGLALRLKGQAPKVEFADKWMNSDETHSLTQAAKLCGVPPNYLIECLADKSYIFRAHAGANWEPAQRLVDNGCLISKPVDRGEKTYRQCKVTGKGLIWISKRWGSECKT